MISTLLICSERSVNSARIASRPKPAASLPWRGELRSVQARLGGGAAILARQRISGLGVEFHCFAPCADHVDPGVTQDAEHSGIQPRAGRVAVQIAQGFLKSGLDQIIGLIGSAGQAARKTAQARQKLDQFCSDVFTHGLFFLYACRCNGCAGRFIPADMNFLWNMLVRSFVKDVTEQTQPLQEVP